MSDRFMVPVRSCPRVDPGLQDPHGVVLANFHQDCKGAVNFKTNPVKLIGFEKVRDPRKNCILQIVRKGVSHERLGYFVLDRGVGRERGREKRGMAKRSLGNLLRGGAGKNIREGRRRGRG